MQLAWQGRRYSKETLVGLPFSSQTPETMKPKELEFLQQYHGGRRNENRHEKHGSSRKDVLVIELKQKFPMSA